MDFFQPPVAKAVSQQKCVFGGPDEILLFTSYIMTIWYKIRVEKAKTKKEGLNPFSCLVIRLNC